MGKKFEAAVKQIDKPAYTLGDAMPLIKKVAFAKFDEMVDVSIRLGVDPKHADQMVRGTVVLPHGLGKTLRVIAIASGDKVREAREAGADEVGGDDLVQKIQGGWLEFDAVVATPDMMKSVGRLGKVLGPRGLMPNPKLGTVTCDVAKAVGEVKAGKVDYRVDKGGVIHVPIGKASFGVAKLTENARTVLAALLRAKPASAKTATIVLFMSCLLSARRLRPRPARRCVGTPRPAPGPRRTRRPPAARRARRGATERCARGQFPAGDAAARCGDPSASASPPARAARPGAPRRSWSGRPCDCPAQSKTGQSAEKTSQPFRPLP